MKGSIRIEVTETNTTEQFPLTTVFTISRDNTYEGIEEWVDVFKKILYIQGFHPDTVKGVFDEK